jgi:hypothetical protein
LNKDAFARSQLIANGRSDLFPSGENTAEPPLLRIDQADIRLAGELNRLLDSATIPKLTNANVHSNKDTNYEHVDVLGKIENIPLLIPLT